LFSVAPNPGISTAQTVATFLGGREANFDAWGVVSRRWWHHFWCCSRSLFICHGTGVHHWRLGSESCV